MNERTFPTLSTKTSQIRTLVAQILEVNAAALQRASVPWVEQEAHFLGVAMEAGGHTALEAFSPQFRWDATDAFMIALCVNI